MPLLLGYTGLSDDMLRQYIQDSQCLWKGHVTDLDCVQLSSVIGTHAGPGAVAVAYFKSSAVQKGYSMITTRAPAPRLERMA